MKRIMLALFATLLFAATAHAQRTLNVSLDYDFTNNAACTASVTTNCIDHFEILDVTGTRVLLASMPLPSNPSGKVTGMKGTYPVTISLGTHMLACVAVVMKNSAGNRVESDATKCTYPVEVPPSGPINFVVTLG